MTFLTAQIEDAQGNVFGIVRHIEQLRTIERFDEIGMFDMMIPALGLGASDAKYIAQGLYVVVADDQREIFRGIIDNRDINDGNYRVSGTDLLAELGYVETGTNHDVGGVPLNEAISGVVGLATGWTVTTAISTLASNGRFRGQQGWAVLQELAKQQGFHLRRGTLRHLEVGAFGADSGVVLANIERVSRQVDTIPIAQFRHMSQINRIVNRVIALGGDYENTSGDRVSLTLGEVAGLFTQYPVKSRIRNSETESYIEDITSIATYGVREAVVSFSEIVPISSSGVAVANAQAALKSRAGYHLQRYGTPQQSYEVVIYHKPSVKVGDKVRVIYQTDTTQLDAMLYVTAIETMYMSNVAYKLSLSTVDAQRLEAESLLAHAVLAIQNLKIRSRSL